MTTDQTLWSFFIDAGPVVKTVMLLLLLASIVSWTFIFQRLFFFKRARLEAQHFTEDFWSGTDLSQLYRQLEHGETEQGGMASIFKAGFKEFIRLRQHVGFNANNLLDGVARAMRIAGAREQQKLQAHLSFLATVGSTAPYIGLFGTVWGIMTSFRALGNVQQATIAMVAPGISEALIATAMGLFAAIPAVIAYNRYANQVENLSEEYDTFQEELSGILARETQANEGAAHA